MINQFLKEAQTINKEEIEKEIAVLIAKKKKASFNSHEKHQLFLKIYGFKKALELLEEQDKSTCPCSQ